MAARIVPTPIVASYAGTIAALTAPTVDGDIVPANSQLLVAAGATPTVVTVPTTGTVSGLPIDDVVVTVAANTTRLIGPFAARLFAQPSDASVGPSKVLVNYSSITTITRVVLA